MPIFIIDNGLRYSGHALYFVEAPEDFGEWFMQTLVPWLRSGSMPGAEMHILGTCESVHWLVEHWKAMTFHDFLNDDSAITEFNYDESPPQSRPHYKGEVLR